MEVAILSTRSAIAGRAILRVCRIKQIGYSLMACMEDVPLPPFEIPELAPKDIRIGTEDLVRLSFPGDRDGFCRIYENEALEIEVTFRRDEPEAVVHLYTNLDGPQDAWREIPFTRGEGGVHRFSYPVTRRGHYQFKIKYSLDGGKNWYWDRLPFSRLVVDPASLKDIRMYTLIPTVSGKVTDWIDRMDRVAELGFNAVHLLPLTELDDSESPYAARDLFTVEPFYRPGDDPRGFDDLRRFVCAARKRGMRLCFDLTLNHIGVNSRMVRECPEWIEPDRREKDGMKRAGCWHMNTWLVWNDLVKIYYDHPHPEIRRSIWDYMTKYSLFWAHFAALTNGMVRLDNLHSSHEGFITHLLEKLREEYPELMVMAEFFTDSNTMIKKAAEWKIDFFLANSWEYPYAEDLRRYMCYLHDIGGRVRHYVPITTHDTGAPAQLFGSPEAAVPRYAVTALMGTGRSGIVQGTEHGYPEKIDFIGRKEPISFADNQVIAEGISRINSLFAAEDLFHREGNIDFVDRGHGAVLVALRRAGREDREGYLVFANLDVNGGYTLDMDLSFLPGFTGNLVLEEWGTDRRETVSCQGFSIFIGPCGVRIFRCRVEV